MRRLLPLLLTLVALTTPAAAQDRDVVFLHGLNSSRAAWKPTADRLALTLAMQPRVPNLDWRQFYESQAAAVAARYADRPANLVVVGHSNGGVVAREWSRHRPMGSLITLGSPNQGAPVVDHIFDWFAYFDSVFARFSGVTEAFTRVNYDSWWWLPGQWTDWFSYGIDAWTTANNGLLSWGLDVSAPVLPEMRVWSAFFNNLNSAGNLNREAQELPQRAAIVSVARDFWMGGPLRMAAPGSYHDWHNAIWASGLSLEALGIVVELTADFGDWDAFVLADRLKSAGEWFIGFEETWCRTVSDPSPLHLGRCYEHDGIVPAWSQTWDHPRVQYLVVTDGPIHTSEIADSDGPLMLALNNVAHIGPRSASGGTTAGSTGGGSLSGGTVGTAPPAPAPAPTGRFKFDGAGRCYWEANDAGPDQCNPTPPPGRFKFDGNGACYWEQNDYPPDQCSMPAAPTGRFKVGDSGCYWDANDNGPDQCVP